VKPPDQAPYGDIFASENARAMYRARPNACPYDKHTETVSQLNRFNYRGSAEKDMSWFAEPKV
jgi:hypothetical protein